MKSKALTLDELKELSTSYFESHPTVDVFLCTHDGMFFLTSNRGDAAAHARNIGSELHTLEREKLIVEVLEAKTEKKSGKKTKADQDEKAPEANS